MGFGYVFHIVFYIWGWDYFFACSFRSGSKLHYTQHLVALQYDAKRLAWPSWQPAT